MPHLPSRFQSKHSTFIDLLTGKKNILKLIIEILLFDKCLPLNSDHAAVNLQKDSQWEYICKETA